MRRKLPVLTERSIEGAHTARLQAAADFDLKARAEGAPSCRKGCSDCCMHPVLISLLEGISIFRYLRDNRLWTKAMKTKFKEASESTWGLSLEMWALALIPCPLLKDGECSAYEGRPTSCRITVSVGDPYLCHPHRMVDAVGLLSKRETFLELSQTEGRYLRPHGLRYARLPFASAVLMGEVIDQGDRDLADVAAIMGPEKM